MNFVNLSQIRDFYKFQKTIGSVIQKNLIGIILWTILMGSAFCNENQKEFFLNHGCEEFSKINLSEQIFTQRERSRNQSIVITLAGDVGLNSSHQKVDPCGIYDARFQPWVDTTSDIRQDIDGDINFINLETVVTNLNTLSPDLKNQKAPFNFRMHPNGLKHLVNSGFNLMSLANNHSMDYGQDGALQTLQYTEALQSNGLLAAAGLGRNLNEAASPKVFHVRDMKIAFAATGIITNDLPRHRATSASPGQLSYRDEADYEDVRKRLVKEDADLHILSIHYGTEGNVRADARQFRDSRELAADKDNIELIVGHHAHVVRGVELRNNSLIFYGLGNFLHHGTADMTKKGICRDYGLLARVYFSRNNDGKMSVKAVEAIPVTNTHYKVRPLKGKEGQARVHVLNYLAATLGSSNGKEHGTRFTPQSNGSGLYCVEGASELDGDIGALCKGFMPAPNIPRELQGQINDSCRH